MPGPDVVRIVNVGDREAVVGQDEFGVVMVVELREEANTRSARTSRSSRRKRLA
jgi:hypothetical protein